MTLRATMMGYKRGEMRPLELAISLRPIPEAASRARQTIRKALEGRVDPETAADTELLVSELVTNSGRHGSLKPGDDIRVRVRMDDLELIVEVTDPGVGFDESAGPAKREKAAGEGGYGLYLLDRMTPAWGVAKPPTRVWFQLHPRSEALSV